MAEENTNITPEVEEKTPVVEEEKTVVETPETPSTDDSDKEEKKFTQTDLNNIIKGRLEKVYKEIDELKTQTKELEELKKQKSELEEKNKESEITLAFITNHIDKEREEDIKIWFKGKGEEITNTTLQEALKSHPEWAEKVSTIAIGNTGGTNNVDNKGDTERKLESVLGYRLIGK